MHDRGGLGRGEGSGVTTRRSCTGWGCLYRAPCSLCRLVILSASLNRPAGNIKEKIIFTSITVYVFSVSIFCLLTKRISWVVISTLVK